MTLRQSPPQSALIIGSGIGGLSTAIILAKLGFEVTVVEKNRKPGGLMRSYTRDGIECAVGVHYLGSLDKGQILRKFFDYFEVTAGIPIQRMGQNGIIDRYFFDAAFSHPKTFDLPEGMDAFEQNLKRAFSDQQHQIDAIMEPMRKMSRQLHGLDFLYSTQNDLSLLDQSRPFGQILNHLRCSPGLRSILAVPSCWIGVPLDDCPAYYHNMALASYVSSSWRLNCSGAHMADVFAERLKELGGRIIFREKVSEVLVRSRSAEGIVLKSGDRLTAPIIIGAVHPQIVLDMLPEGVVRPSYRKRISSLKNTHGIFSVHARIDADAHEEIPYNIFKIETDRNGDVPDLKYYQIRKSEREGINTLSVLTSGKTELWHPWVNTRSGRRGTAYYEAKEAEAVRLIREAEEFFGPLKGMKILDAYTPLTLRDWVNSPEGSAYGVLRSASQMLAAALLNRTSVKGLYLAGQSVLAPGIIGTIMGSFSTVKLILGDKTFRKNIQI